MTRLATMAFVLIWSTGWVAVGYAIPFANAFSFLTIRFGLASILIGALALLVGARWPKGRAAWLRAIFSGVILQGLYLMGVWWAVQQGVPAGISGLIAAVQPLLTALLSARMAGEPLSRAQWLGIGLGFVGVMLVLEPKILVAFDDHVAGKSLMVPIIANMLGMVCATLGTLYQKKHFANEDLRSLNALQAFGGFLPVVLMVLLFVPWHFEVRLETMLTLGWTVLGLSFAGTGLLLYLIKKGEVARVSSLIFLMPPLVAIQTFFLLGERLLPVQIGGMLVVMVGVYLAVKRQKADRPAPSISASKF
jgi:drug/metabolite transporter (DMT)-like permease